MDISNRLEDIKQKPEKMVSGIFKIARYGRDNFKDYLKKIANIWHAQPELMPQYYVKISYGYLKPFGRY